MEINHIHVIIDQLAQALALATLIVSSGVITSVLTEVFKWNVFRQIAKKFPRITAGVLSAGVSIGVIVTQGTISIFNLANMIWFIFTVFIAATQLYDKVLYKIYEKIKEM